MSHHLEAYNAKRNAEPLTEMKRRHFIMLAKGRDDMRAFLLSLGLNAPTEVVVEVEKAFYLASLDGDTLGLEGAYEEALHCSSKALVVCVASQDISPSMKRQNILTHLALVNEGREGGEAAAAMTRVVKSFLDAMKDSYADLPPPLREEGREAVLDELSKWEPRLTRCGMDLEAARHHVLGLGAVEEV